MFRRAISYLVTAVIALTSSPASAQEYFFRYTSASNLSAAPAPQPEYGVGNDIVAYFVASVDQAVTKEIPVKTDDVVLWVRDTGGLPDGIELQARAGSIVGASGASVKTAALFYGYDISGNRIARAQINFTIFEPIGEHQTVDYYTHTGEYFYTQVPVQTGVVVDHWEALHGNPDGMATRDGAFEGVPSSAGSYDLAWIGYDYLKRPIVTASGTFLVQDGPTFDGPIADQIVNFDAGENFNRVPKIERAIGTLTYKLVELNGRPEGLTFDSDSGRIGGTYEEPDLAKEYQVEVRDSATGRKTLSNIFNLGTSASAGNPEFPPELAFHLNSLTIKKNSPFTSPAPRLIDKNVEGQYFTLGETTPLPDGVSFANGILSSETGIAAPGRYYFDIESRTDASGPYVRKLYVTVLDDLELSYPVKVTKKYDWISVQPTIQGGPAVAPITFQNVNLPSWLRPNMGGQLQGVVPKDVEEGRIGPFAVSIADAYNKAGVQSKPIFIDILDRDKIEGTVKSTNLQRFIGNSYHAGDYLASLENTEGEIKVEVVSGDLPDGVNVRPVFRQLILSGSTDDPVGTSYEDIVVKVTDQDGETYSWTSEPFDVVVVEPERLGGLNGRLNGSMKWVEGIGFSLALPDLANGYGEITYTLLDDSLGLNVAGGRLEGLVDLPGVHEIRFSAKDETPRTAVEGVVRLEIVPKLTVSFVTIPTLNRGSDVTITPVRVGGVGPFIYSVDPAYNLPAGLSLNPSTGVIVGNPKAEGTTAVRLKVIDKVTGETAFTNIVDLTVGEPLPFDFSYGSALEYVIGKQIASEPIIENQLGTIIWRHVGGALPRGVRFLENGPLAGSFYGVPEEIGIWEDVEIQAVDTQTPEKPVDKTLRIVVSPVGSVGFGNQGFKARVGAAATFNIAASNGVGAFTYSFKSETEAYPDAIELDGRTGQIKVQFDEPGTYKVTMVAGDAAGRSKEAEMTFEVVDQLSVIAPEVMNFRQYEESPQGFTVDNLIGSASYMLAPNSASLPAGLQVNPLTGEIIGEPDVYGEVDGLILRVTDSFDESFRHSAPFRVAVEQRPQMSMEDVTISTTRYLPINAILRPAEAIGAVTYTFTPALPASLSFDPTSGRLTGSFEETYAANLVVRAVDSKGGQLGTAAATLTIAVGEREKLTLEPAAVVLKQYEDRGRAPVGELTGQVAPPVWSLIPSELPEGLHFDAQTGEIFGKASEYTASPREYVVHVSDGKGGALGQDSKTVTLVVEERDPLTINGPSEFIFNQFFQGTFSVTQENAIDGHEFTVVPALPAEFSLDGKTGVVTATPDARFDERIYTFNVKDGVGDTQSHQVKLSVSERLKPVVLTTGTQNALLGYPIDLDLQADRVLGTLTWEVSGTLPTGVSFDVASQSFVGSPSRFGLLDGVQLVAVDTFNGVVTKSPAQTISINVMQDGTPLGLIATGKISRVGQSLVTAAPVVSELVGKATFTATGLDGTGLVIDRDTGVIRGTSSRVFTQTVEITVTDVTGRSATRTVEVGFAPEIGLSFGLEQDLIYNYTFEKAGLLQPLARDLHSSAVWTISGAENLPEGLIFDEQTGTFTGEPEEVGAFGPFYLTVGDDLPGTATVGPIWFTVLMNDDPIELTGYDLMTKVGMQFTTPKPEYDNVLGKPRYFSNDLPAGLRIDPDTGVITGSYSEVDDVTVNVAVTDDTLRITSVPVNIQVLPRMVLTGPQIATVNAQETIVPIKVTRAYAVGTAVWEPIPAEALPEGITFNTVTGQFEGSTDHLGEFGPYTVKSTDSLKDTGTSNPITLKVQKGPYYLKLSGGTLPSVRKKIDTFTFGFRSLIKSEDIEGMDVSEVSWSWRAASGSQLPQGITLNPTTGVASGVPKFYGDYKIIVTASGKGKTSSREYDLVITRPDFALELADGVIPSGDTVSKYDFDFDSFMTKTNILDNEVVWSINQTYGMKFDVTQDRGRLSGYPNVPTQAEATVDLVVTAKFDDGQDVLTTSKTYRLVVKKINAMGTWWKVEGASYRTSYPLYAEIEMYDATGKEVAHDTEMQRSRSGSEHVFDGATGVNSWYQVGTPPMIYFKQVVDMKQIKIIHGQSRYQQPDWYTKSLKISKSADGKNWTVVLDTAATGDLPSQGTLILNLP